MINGLNNCGAISNLGLSKYGSYCGLGGEGVPVDELDQCCCHHDRCYGDVDNKCSGKVCIAEGL